MYSQISVDKPSLGIYSVLTLIKEAVMNQQILMFKPQVGETVRVESVEDAARKWEEYRARTGGGVSEIGNGGVVYGTSKSGKGCKVFARIAYNGKITL